MWAQVILAALQAAPSIIKSVESMFPGKGRGDEKKAAANAQQQAAEPAVISTPALDAARAAKIAADVAYADALAAAMPK